MQIASKKRRLSRKKLVVITACVIALVAGIGAYAWYTHQPSLNQMVAVKTTPTNTVNYGPPTAQQQADTEQHKQDIANQGTAGPATQPATLQITITRFGQTSRGADLNIRAQVDGTTTGTCATEFSRNGQNNIVKTFPIVFQATSSSCGNVDIAASTFPVAGDWNLKLSATSGTSTSNTEQRVVSIQK